MFFSYWFNFIGFWISVLVILYCKFIINRIWFCIIGYVFFVKVFIEMIFIFRYWICVVFVLYFIFYIVWISICCLCWLKVLFFVNGIEFNYVFVCFFVSCDVVFFIVLGNWVCIWMIFYFCFNFIRFWICVLVILNC